MEIKEAYKLAYEVCPIGIWVDEELRPKDKLIYLALCSFSAEQGTENECLVSSRLLAKRAGISLRAVYSQRATEGAIERLEKRGYVMVEKVPYHSGLDRNRFILARDGEYATV